MAKTTKILILAIVAFFLPIATVAAQNPQSLPQGDFSALKQTGTGTVERMIDPVTMQLTDGRLVRLSGLDIPDFKPLEPGDISLASLAVLDDMLAGQNVTLYQTMKKDLGRLNRMGHVLAHVKRDRDDAWAQGTLLTLGLARVRTSQRNPEMAAQMLALEAAARESKLGLWADQQYRVLTPDTAPQHINGFQIVEGRVHSATMRNNRIFVNFGSDWRRDFTISIPSAARRLFSKQGLDPLTWAHKSVRVRGWLEEYNGPSIIVDHPEAIELLE